MINPPSLQTSEERLEDLKSTHECLRRLTAHVDWKHLDAHQRVTEKALGAYKQAKEDHERDPRKLYPLF